MKAIFKILAIPACYAVAIPSAILFFPGALMVLLGSKGISAAKRLANFATFRPCPGNIEVWTARCGKLMTGFRCANGKLRHIAPVNEDIFPSSKL